MPFVNLEHREKPDYTIPGDRCYFEYAKMMQAWRIESRWSMVDAIAREIWPNAWKRAMILAFLVFFNLHVMPYEKSKRKENGDI